MFGDYFVTYAVSEVKGELDKQTEATLNKNVKFDAFFVEDDENTHYKTADVNGDMPQIKLELEVKKEGYLKNAVISLKTDNEEIPLNYKISSIEDKSEMIQEYNQKSIHLRQINKDEKLEAYLKIAPELGEKISKDILKQNSKILINGTYIDNRGEEIPIEKDVTINLEWTGKYEIQKNLEIEKYIPLEINGQKKVYVQYNLKTGIIQPKSVGSAISRPQEEQAQYENIIAHPQETQTKLPIKSTQIEMKLPEFNGIKPEKVDVIAKNTMATNGLDEENVKFSTDNWKKVDDDSISIKVDNEEDQNGNINVGTGNDEYLITFVYPEEAYNKINNNQTEISTNLKITVNMYTEDELETEELITKKVQEPIGKLLSIKGIAKTEKIGKGKMYANLNSSEKKNETEYEISTQINVGYAENIEKIRLQNWEEKVTTTYGEQYEIGKYTRYISTKINKASFLQVLGEDGKITIKNAKEGEIAVINKLTNVDENGDFIFNYYGDVSNIIIETSEPIAEGNLIINNTKAIKGSLPYTKAGIESFASLTSSVILAQKEVDSKSLLQIEQCNVEIPFEETSTKARLTIDTEQLSTLVPNENVEFKIELGNSSEASDLYINPVFDIELPNYIEDIEIKESRILYDNELSIKNIEKLKNSNGGITLRVELYGVQTKFSTGKITNGTNIILNSDIKVNILTPNIEDTIKMYYYNSNSKKLDNMVETESGPAGLATVNISYAAPTGLVSVNNWSNIDETGKSVMSVNQGTLVEKVDTFKSSRASNMDLILINNTGNECDDITMLVRMPFEGNKSALTGEDLGTTIDGKLLSYIQPNGVDDNKFKIFYSENGEANKNLNDAKNGWKEEVDNLNNVKSCLIVGQDYKLQKGESISFSYIEEVPGNMSYNNTMLSNFATYYNEVSEVASIPQETQSNIVGITTGKGPELSIKQEVEGADENGKVQQYGVLKYRITIENTGTESAKDVVITNQIPKWTDLVRTVKGEYNMSATESYPITTTMDEELTKIIENSTNPDDYKNIDFSKHISVTLPDAQTMKEWNVVDNGNVLENIPPTLQWNFDEIEQGKTAEVEFEVRMQGKPDIYTYYKDYSGFTLGEDGKYYIITKTYDVNTDTTTEKRNEITQVPDIEIVNKATVKASNYNTDKQVSSDPITVFSEEITAEERLITQGDVIGENEEEVRFSIIIMNRNTDKNYNNFHFEKILPEKLKLEDAYYTISKPQNKEDNIENNDEKEKNDIYYNPTTRKLTFELEELKSTEAIVVYIEAKTEKLDQGIFETEIESNSIIKADGTEEIKTVPVKFSIGKPNIKMEASFSDNKYLHAGEIHEYKIRVENTGNIATEAFSIKQKIPEGLKFISTDYTFMDMNLPAKMLNTREVEAPIMLSPGGVAEIVTKVEVLALEKDTAISSKIETNGNTIEKKLITIQNIIEKSENAPKSDDSSEKGDKTDGTNSNDKTNTNRKNNKLQGIVWVDSNENGKREAEEQTLSGINVILINADSGSTALDQNNKEVRTTTNEKGEYYISDLNDGNYIVVFKYDTKIYTATHYKVGTAGEMYDSDGIEREITENGETGLAGVTNTINLVNSMSNIDMGLIERDKFDLKFEKYVTVVNVQNKEGIKKHEYNNSKLVQVPITGKQLDNTTVIIEYSLKVTNEGNLAGYAKNIVDYKPKELMFNSELNPNWYLGNDGNLYTTSLANVLISPGETKEVKLILTKKLTESSTGIVNNNAEIKEAYNERGTKDRDSTPGNNRQNEDDQDSVDILITVRTGGQIITFSAFIIAVLIAVVIIIYVVRKKHINAN